MSATAVVLEGLAAKTNPAWLEAVLAIIQNLAQAHLEFSTEDITNQMSSKPDFPTTSSKRSIGVALLAAQRLGYIEPTKRSHRRSNPKYRNLVIVWRSKLHPDAVKYAECPHCHGCGEVPTEEKWNS